MSKESESVFALFLRLSEPDRSNLIARINEYLGGDAKKKVLLEQQFGTIQRISLGPKGSACPLCGRS